MKQDLYGFRAALSRGIKRQIEKHESNYVQTALALGMDRKTLMGYANGKFYPRADTLYKMHVFRNVSMDELMGVDEL